MTKNIKNNNLLASLSPIITISSFFGLLPLAIDYRTKKYVLSAAMKVISILYIIGFTLCVLQVISVSKHTDMLRLFKNVISNMGLVMWITGQVIVTYVLYIFCFIKLKSVKKILRKLNEIDIKLEILGILLNYQKTMKYQFIVLIGGLTGLSLLYVTQIINVSQNNIIFLSISLCVLFYFPRCIIFLTVIKFTIFTFEVYQRFSKINKQLRQNNIIYKKYVNYEGFEIFPQIGKTVNISSLNEFKFNILFLVMPKNKKKLEKEFEKKIEICREIHDNLCDIANEINDCFMFQLLAIITLHFLIIVFSVFYTYYSYFVST